LRTFIVPPLAASWDESGDNERSPVLTLLKAVAKKRSPSNQLWGFEYSLGAVMLPIGVKQQRDRSLSSQRQRGVKTRREI